jgi:hypothetical protein
MSIQFVCMCGKHLRAREDMAGRRSMCPACGAPVGIPLLRPTHAGATLGHMSLDELLRTKRTIPSSRVVTFDDFAPPTNAGTTPVPRSHPQPARRLEITFDGPISPALVHQVISRAPTRRVPVKPWAQSILYPLRLALPLLGLAIVLAGLTAAPLLLAGELHDLTTSGPVALLVCLLYLLGPLVALAYACAMLDGAFASGAAGDSRHVYWPGRDFGPVIKSGIRWLLCFVAGPVLPAGGALLYWVNCGDLEWIDWVILVDLTALAVGYWLFALLAVSERDRLLDVNPVRVAEQIERLRYRAPVAVVAAAALAFAHGLWALSALDQIHDAGASGWLLLGACWLSSLLLGTVFFRLLGVWSQRPPPRANPLPS